MKLETFNTKDPAHKPHILLIDDDAIFRAKFEHAASLLNIPVTTCSSLRELEPMATQGKFDIAVIDYFLDGVSENLKGTNVAYLMGCTPVLLVSGSDHCLATPESWPESIRKFIPKEQGVSAIIKSALGLWSGMAPPRYSVAVAA
jgi:DNA-binding NtrC family response regulator